MDEPPGLFELMSWTASPCRPGRRSVPRPVRLFVDTAVRPAEPPDEVADLARRRVRTAGFRSKTVGLSPRICRVP